MGLYDGFYTATLALSFSGMLRVLRVELRKSCAARLLRRADVPRLRWSLLEPLEEVSHEPVPKKNTAMKK